MYGKVFMTGSLTFSPLPSSAAPDPHAPIMLAPPQPLPNAPVVPTFPFKMNKAREKCRKSREIRYTTGSFHPFNSASSRQRIYLTVGPVPFLYSFLKVKYQ